MSLPEVNYGVVQNGDRWMIVGAGLKVGGYRDRSSAVRAAGRLALQSAGLPVRLHLQDDTGELLPPSQVTED